MTLPFNLPLEPSRDKKLLRKQLQAERQSLVDRHQRAVHLQEVLRVWLVSRQEATIGAYWPIKGEFDSLPALYRWSEAHDHRRIGLPVIDRETKRLSFHTWYPGCPMEEDAYGIPKPKDTERFAPQLLLVPCVGFGPGGLRLGYGGGFYDRTLADIDPAPLTVGVGYAHGFVPWLDAEAHDVPLDVILTEDGVHWQRSGLQAPFAFGTPTRFFVNIEKMAEGAGTLAAAFSHISRYQVEPGVDIIGLMTDCVLRTVQTVKVIGRSRVARRAAVRRE